MRLLIAAILGSASAGRLGEHNTGLHHAASTFGHHAGSTGSTSDPHSAVFTHIFTFNGIMTFEDHAVVFRNGEIRIRAYPLSIGQSGTGEIEAGLAYLPTGEQIHIDDGLISVLKLQSTNLEPLVDSLARAGLTPDQFIQLTGTIPPQQGIVDVTAGVISINGQLKNVIAGVLVVLSAELVDPVSTEGCSKACTREYSPVCGSDGRVYNNPCLLEITQCNQNELVEVACETQTPVDLATELVQTVTVTETAAHETETVFEPVTLIKTQTRDEFFTVTSPVYNTIAATITNLVRQTVTVPDEQVIRSPVAGSLVVNTIPVPFQTVLTVTNRATNLYVRTITEQIVNPHDHYVTNYSIGTVTVNNPVTSTVVQTITQTSVATTYLTSTIGSTVFTTTTEVIYIGGTATPVGAY